MMSLGRALGALTFMELSRSRSLHQRRTRRPFPVIPDARMKIPEQSSRPPRILVKSFLALHHLDSVYMQGAPRDLRDFFMSSWKNAKR
ncbi:uncharacterized protein LOC6528560 [Drosophila yakuba]|uniref:Uncharacterized protein n=1 Tax=Drosophila yakuba TaxID=7245 RepID=B4P2Q5_DROYA|nr:uncharacterized protein LOC6528560 [Drosophila yakuba]EDW89316.1 uncharacterized protein Dyak_GE19187 [Drosophila yakuba]